MDDALEGAAVYRGVTMITAYILVSILVLYVVSEMFHRAERTKLLNRLMAKDYKEFRYYQEKWPGDLKEIEKVRDETREELKEELKTAKKDGEEEDDPDNLY
jgi:biopolymer transport protein ExbB/TolQ